MVATVRSKERVYRDAPPASLQQSGLQPSGLQPSEVRHAELTPDEVLDIVHQERRTAPVAQRIAVRLFDLVLSTTAVLVLLPVFLFLILAITLTSPGAPVFVHRRLGRGGRTFPLLKFRSMYRDAEVRLINVLATDEVAAQEWAEARKIRRDPRVTALGSIIRRLNLDELPQLLNVVAGHMSLVGPRPIVKAETARFGRALPAVLSVKPGLTGLWQVSGRNDITYESRVDLDLEYVETRTLCRDLRICCKTALLMLRPWSNGAY